MIRGQLRSEMREPALTRLMALAPLDGPAVAALTAALALARGVRLRRDIVTEGREISTTMAFVQTLNIILRDKLVGPRVVPIVAGRREHLPVSCRACSGRAVRPTTW